MIVEVISQVGPFWHQFSLGVCMSDYLFLMSQSCLLRTNIIMICDTVILFTCEYYHLGHFESAFLIVRTPIVSGNCTKILAIIKTQRFQFLISRPLENLSQWYVIKFWSSSTQSWYSRSSVLYKEWITNNDHHYCWTLNIVILS